ncbi:MAG: glutamate 5-kinase [Bacteroidetes bacterium]|nr:MAG: glutamate 5-kinase [Bacteroidota bacterium]
MQKPVLVIKLGTAAISDDKGFIDKSVIKKLAAELAEISKEYYLVLVSSGAVGSGKRFFPKYKGSLIERKAAAAVGNPILIQLYHKYFFRYGITVAQALCERHHFSNRQQFLQLKETFNEFWDNNILPVVNENDLVSNVELKFSDNDELATLIAVGFNASKMVIATSVGGLLNKEGAVIDRVEKIDSEIRSFVDTKKSSSGLGGMVSKLTFTRLATSLGIQVIMCGLNGKSPISKALAGKSGTIFEAGKSDLKSRQKWLASGSITFGGLRIDSGAATALASRKSLLTVGIREVLGNFSAGEVIQIKDEADTILGVAKSKIGSSEIKDQLKQKNKVAAHADDIVIF